MAKKELNVPDRFSYLNEYWSAVAGANIVDIIDEEVISDESYQINEKHLYKLANGRYAVVHESGCSCYSMGDADVTTYDTLKAARAAYKELS